MAKQGKVAGRARVVVGLDNELPKGLKTALKDMKTFATAAQGIGLGLAAAGGAMVTPAFLSARTFAGFSDEMSVVKALTNATAGEFSVLSEKAQAVGVATGYAGAEVATVMKELARAGFTTNQVLDSTAATMALIRAGAVDAGTGTKYMADAIRSFGLSAADSGYVADVLVKAANSATMNVELLGEAFKHISASANLSGQKIEKMAAAIAVLSNRGLKGELAGTSLNQAIVHLVDPQVIQDLDALGVKVKDNAGNMRDLMDIIRDLGNALKGMGNVDVLSAMRDFFDVRGMRAVSILSQNMGDWKEMAGTLQNAGGEAKRVAAIMQDNLGGSFRSLMAEVDKLENAVGKALTPSLRILMEHVAGAASGLAEFAEKHDVLVTAIAGLGGAATITGVALAGIGTAMLGASAMVTAGAKAWYGLQKVAKATEVELTAEGAAVLAAGNAATVAAGQTITLDRALIEAMSALASVGNNAGIAATRLLGYADAVIVARTATQQATSAALTGGTGIVKYSRNWSTFAQAYAGGTAAAKDFKDEIVGTATHITSMGTAAAASAGRITLATIATKALSAAGTIAAGSMKLLNAAIPVIGWALLADQIIRTAGELLGLDKVMQNFINRLYEVKELSREKLATDFFAKGYNQENARFEEEIDKLRGQLSAGKVTEEQYKELFNAEYEKHNDRIEKLREWYRNQINEPEAAPTSDEDMARRQRLLELDRRISENRLQLVEDNKEREIALIRERMENEIADAKYGEDEKKKIRLAAGLEIQAVELKYLHDKQEEEKRLTESSAKSLRDLKISMIADEYDRRRAEIAATEADEIAAANGVWPAIQAAMEKRKLAEQKIENDKSKVQSEANQDWGYEIEEKNLELNYEGYELDKKRLELAHKIALARAEAAGLDTTLLKQLQGLEMQTLEMKNQPSNNLSSMGTFSSMNISQMFGVGGSTFDRIAKATEQTAKNTAKPGSVPAWQ
jgi:TP901 family phage tail tape measure protein